MSKVYVILNTDSEHTEIVSIHKTEAAALHALETYKVKDHFRPYFGRWFEIEEHDLID